MRTATETIIEQYMKELQRELRAFPAARKREILDEVRDHISQARAELESESEAAVRTELDRLGEPADIAAAARERFGVRPARAGALEVWTIIALVIPYFGWLIGSVLVWMSRVWTTRDKLLTVILVPGVWLLLLTSSIAVGSEATSGSGRTCRVEVGTDRVSCNPPPPPRADPSWLEWVGAAIWVAAFVVPVAIAVYLAIRARKLSDAEAA